MRIGTLVVHSLASGLLIGALTGCPDSPKEVLPAHIAKLKADAEAGNTDAQHKLGLAYAEGTGIPEDDVEALHWFGRAAESGHVAAQKRVAGMYFNGEGTPKDTAKAFAWFQKAAAQGDASAQYAIAVMYSDGLDFEKDLRSAADWYLRAAEQGHARAQYELGLLYYSGGGVGQDFGKAIEWWGKSAAQDEAEAQYALGKAYIVGGIGSVSKDRAKGLEWIRKAARQGLDRAQSLLGWHYLNGNGVSKDVVKAREWLQRAATQGDVFGQKLLGQIYFEGQGVPKDFAKAFEWWQKSAIRGDPWAQTAIAHAYYYGNGVTRDEVLAYAWANLSAAQGDKTGITQRDWLENLLPPHLKAEGQRLASTWKQGKTLRRETARGVASSDESTDGPPVKRGSGTAFTISFAGHGLTNYHVVAGCKEIRIAGQLGLAKLVVSDQVNDLALIQLPGLVADAARLVERAGNVRQGDDVVVYGFPLQAILSSSGNLTPGTVSALAGLGNNTSQIQITAPIQPGSSGSPVMNRKGEIVGMVSARLSDSKTAKATGSLPQNVNFAINGQTIRTFLDANGVAYKVGAGFFSGEKSNADLAAEARRWTLLLECWK